MLFRSVSRVGVPLIGGVAGEVEVFGNDYQELWDKADMRDLLRWFVPGWAGVTSCCTSS